MNIYQSSIINFSKVVDMPINFINKVYDTTFYTNYISTADNIYNSALLTIYAYHDELDTICIKYFFFVENESAVKDIYEIDENIYTQLMSVCSNLLTWYSYCLHDRNITLYSVSYTNQEILLLNDSIKFDEYITLSKPISINQLTKLKKQLKLINTPDKLINLIEAHIFMTIYLVDK